MRARKSSIIFWGMGISQHVHGTDNARCLIALALITGQVGRPGTGLHPLRGQNNVQGASDAGLIPMFLPDYQPVGRDDMRGAFEKLWGQELDPVRGLTVVEIMNAIHAGEIQRHVCRGRESGDVGPRLAARARGAGHARSSGGAGSVRHRDRVPRRRDPAGLGVRRKIRLLHQYRPPRAVGARGDKAAGRRPAGSLDHPGDRQAHGAALELFGSGRGLHRDGATDAVAQQHHLGAAGARGRGDVSGRRSL